MCMYVGEHVCRPSLLCNPVIDKIDNNNNTFIKSVFSPRDVHISIYLEDYGALVYNVAVLSSSCFLSACLT